MKHKLSAWLSDREGSVAFEYAFLGGLVGVVIIAAACAFAGDFNGMFENVFSAYLRNELDGGA